MDKLYSNKHVQAGAFALSMALLGFAVYYGLTMADSGTGTLAGNFSPKQVTFAGLSLGAIWVVARSLAGKNFKENEMPKPIMILWCVLLFVGAIISRQQNDGKASTGSAIFLSGALLPLFFYVVLGIFINKIRR